MLSRHCGFFLAKIASVHVQTEVGGLGEALAHGYMSVWAGACQFVMNWCQSKLLLHVILHAELAQSRKFLGGPEVSETNQKGQRGSWMLDFSPCAML